MKIAVAAEGDKVSLHFGKCPEFRVFHVEGGKVQALETLRNPGDEPGAIPDFLAEHGVSVVIAGGMGPRAEKLLKDSGIQVVTGVLGPVDDIVKSYLEGSLSPGPVASALG